MSSQTITHVFHNVNVISRKLMDDLWNICGKSHVSDKDFMIDDITGTVSPEVIKHALETTITLELEKTKIGDEVAVAIGEGLKTNTTLKKLVLGNSGYVPSLGPAIAEALRTNTTLEDLTITRNRIAQVDSIVRVLNTNHTLTSLDLSYNGLGEQFGVDIAAVLGRNTTLTTLILCNNHLDDDAGVAIADAMITNTMLTTLDLSANQLDDDAGMAFAEALRKNSSLVTLNVELNDIAVNVEQQIASMLRGRIASHFVAKAHVIPMMRSVGSLVPLLLL